MEKKEELIAWKGWEERKVARGERCEVRKERKKGNGEEGKNDCDKYKTSRRSRRKGNGERKRGNI